MIPENPVFFGERGGGGKHFPRELLSVWHTNGLNHLIQVTLLDSTIRSPGIQMTSGYVLHKRMVSWESKCRKVSMVLQLGSLSQ